MSEGPFVRSLDKALGAMNVHRQAYYGGTFIGNHVHKCLKVSNYNHTQIITIKIYGPFFPSTATHFAQHLSFLHSNPVQPSQPLHIQSAKSMKKLWHYSQTAIKCTTVQKK